jgi:CubicO group peptidase (beta-lactamase class C family)
MRYSLVANGEPLPSAQPETVVPWWSFGKTVLAATALTLVRDGLLGLDDEVAAGPFTLRQLLQHQAGLADYSELPAYHAAVAAGDTPWSFSKMLDRLEAGRLRYPPGSQWRYSNVGYSYIAQLIERSTDLPLQEALQQRLFRPLELSAITLATTPEQLSVVDLGVAAGYHPGWVYHGLLIGPLAEAALLLERLFSHNLLPRTLLDDLQNTRVLGGPMTGRPWAAPGYALGLMSGATHNGLTLRGHTGSGPGSNIAVYHCRHEGRSATCAVFSEYEDQGAVETQALHYLTATLHHG